MIGSKELIGVAGRCTSGSARATWSRYPELAYPTYEVGAALAGARGVATDSLTALGPETPALLWINSPSNPTGRVLPARAPEARSSTGAASAARSWSPTSATSSAPGTRARSSVLHPDVCGGSHEGILAVHSLSKRSNLAGYRCAFVAGDPALVGELLAVRKNLGLQMPGPQQAAMVAALDDDEHVAEQHARYAARRATLRDGAASGAGFRIDHSEASLYLWATRDERLLGHRSAGSPSAASWSRPAPFYGPAGARHVRVAFTATDERIDAARARLGA